VIQEHLEDLWGIALVTAGILAALALYGDALGPAGHGVRYGLALSVGIVRFLLPLACVAAGVLLVAGPPGHEPAREAIGLVLALAAAAGLADLWGGAPHLTARPGRLGGAGGWLGVLSGNPLRAGMGDWGASVVLVALGAIALVLFTGVTLRSVGRAVLRIGAELWALVGFEADDEEVDPEALDEADIEEMPAVDSTPPTSSAAAPAGDDSAEGDAAQESVDLESSRGATDPGERVADSGGFGPPSALTRRPVSMEAETLAGEWRLPPLKSLARSKQQQLDRSEVATAGRALVAALGAHGVDTKLVGHTVGPTVTRFELELGPGVKVARVTSLAKDIAYAMASPDVRILAPIPGRSAIGVEVPNRRRQLVTLGDVLASDDARRATHPLEVALGRDIAGRPVMANLADMPHILISGATGAGKSSCINSLVTSVLMRSTPEEVRLILVDPKRVELGQYNGLPHLLTPVVVDPKKAANALSWAVTEMERRYDILAEAGMRDITSYNAAIERGDLDAESDDELDDQLDEELDGEPEGATDDDDDFESEQEPEDDEELDDAEDALSGSAAEHDGAHEELSAASARAAARVAESRAAVVSTPSRQRLPFVLVVVDELNDLMMVAARDVEESVCRIAQMARAVGIHLVLATQRPSVDVITGVIKANIPSRLAFSVSSLADSRVILDQPGAERLIGKGDMLLLTASSSVPRRIQGPWVAESEVRAVVAHWRRQHVPEYVLGIAEDDEPTLGRDGFEDDDDLLPAAMELVVRSQLGSTSMLQRKLRVGFSRAGRLMDLLERRGVVGASEGSKARAVLMTPDELEQLSSR
jgi:S-DNA-T family DNA segregation ATPase FtsK/SpoIIIE